MKVLGIPDCHVEPGQDLSRFDWAGRFIEQERPDIVILFGDFITVSSLSHWDRNKRLLMEGRRYQADIEAGRQALTRLWYPIDKANAKAKRLKMRQYKPSKIYIEGNHEIWIQRYVEQHSEVEDFMDLRRDLGLGDYTFVPYEEEYELGGINFCHVPKARNNQPVSGKYGTARAVERHMNPVIYAHTHGWQHHTERRIDSEQLIEAMTIGCYFEGEPDYAKGSFGNYWRGLTMFDLYGDGKFDFQRISMEVLKEKFGG